MFEETVGMWSREIDIGREGERDRERERKRKSERERE